MTILPNPIKDFKEHNHISHLSATNLSFLLHNKEKYLYYGNIVQQKSLLFRSNARMWTENNLKLSYFKTFTNVIYGMKREFIVRLL